MGADFGPCIGLGSVSVLTYFRGVFSGGECRRCLEVCKEWRRRFVGGAAAHGLQLVAKLVLWDGVRKKLGVIRGQCLTTVGQNSRFVYLR